MSEKTNLGVGVKLGRTDELSEVIEAENKEFAIYKFEVFSIGPINGEEKAKKYRTAIVNHFQATDRIHKTNKTKKLVNLIKSLGLDY